jgi:hypothetical protein
MSAFMLFPNQPVAALICIRRSETSRRHGQHMIQVAGTRIEVADEAPQIRFDDPALPLPGFPRCAASRARDDPADAPQYLIVSYRISIRRHYRLIADMRVSNILLTAVMTCAEAE